MVDLKETGLCFCHGKDEKLFLHTGSKKYIKKYKKMALEFPDDVKVTVENSDGSICVVMPSECFVPPRMKKKRVMTEKQKAAMNERAEKMRKGKASKNES